MKPMPMLYAADYMYDPFIRSIPPVPRYAHPYHRPGVCSICGCAVVQPHHLYPHPDGVWVNGHLRAIPKKGPQVSALLDVRCLRHKHESDRGETDGPKETREPLTEQREYLPS